ncbi:MAG: protease modulator HflC [Hyphomicrobiaceae bacterium]|nr:MAG: protease modulator HflC [Hyphomicrobiaceae bacterium]
MRGFLYSIVVLLIGAAAAVFGSAFIVHQWEQALVVRFGDPKQLVTEPGLNWKMPFIESVVYFDKRILDLEIDKREINSVDGKRLDVDAFVRFRVTRPLEFYRKFNNEERARGQLRQSLDSSVRAVLGAAFFLDIVRDKRESLMAEILKQLNSEANSNNFGLEIVDVRIKRADLPQQNSKAIYDRMRTDREREAQFFRSTGKQKALAITSGADREATKLRAEATRESEEIKGAADREVTQIFADAYNRDPEFAIFYRSMLAYEHALEPGKTRMLLSPDSEFFRYFQNPMPAPKTPAK